MQPVQLNSKDGLAAGWIGIGGADKLAERARSSAPSAPDDVRTAGERDVASTGRGWLHAGLRFARNAAIGLALLSSVPIAVIGMFGGRYQSLDTTANRERLESSERLRAFTAPKDAAITPTEAGIALRALQSGKSSADFQMHDVGAPHARPWKTLVLTSGMFAGLRNGNFSGLATSRIISAASKSFSPAELTYLRTIAEASLWKDFDRVATAGAVDVIGGQFVLPFSEKAYVYAMPAIRYADSRELASAGVMRAAYYVGVRDFERAEAVLKTVVSFGFALIDNATNSMDAAVGRVIVGIAGDGLMQFYTATNKETLAAALKPAHLSVAKGARNVRPRVDAAVLRARLLADANNPNLSRGLRYESLSKLSFSSCGNVREVLFGPSKEIGDAYAGARQTLARYPSEQAHLDLMLHAMDRIPEDAGVLLAPERFLVGAATVAGTILNNPRVASCTRMAMLSF
ncbi:MAG: hypothetical protein H7Z40_08855 [Phycisphaerae bacterium]|nr:hypothetical protein [Gemmatimonadaceae bacterium]